MYALFFTSFAMIYCGYYQTAKSLLDELSALADEKDALQWKANGMMQRGWVLTRSGEALAGSSMIASGLSASRSTGATVTEPLCLSILAASYADIGQFDEAWRCLNEAIRTIEPTKERWFEAEVNRIAGEITLQSPENDLSKAVAYFERGGRRPPTTSQILGTPRRHEPRTPLARPGQGERSARTVGSGLRVVHRGLRHARSEGG
jgi:tetratricopeptide (TPR) repeat protein